MSPGRMELEVEEVLVSFIWFAGQQLRAVIMNFRAEGSSLFPRDNREQRRTCDPVTSEGSTAALSYAELRVDSRPDVTFEIFLLHKYAALSESYTSGPTHRYFSLTCVCFSIEDNHVYSSVLCRWWELFSHVWTSGWRCLRARSLNSGCF